MKRFGLFLVIIAVLAAVVTLPSDTAHAELTMTIDRNMLDFGVLDPGQKRVLSEQGVFHNQVTCTSDNQRTWYLKTQLIRPFTSGRNTIPSENFRWMVVSLGNGRGTVLNDINTENQFTSQPTIIYTSADTDDTGTAVNLQIRYILDIPEDQIAGSYDAVIRFTTIETL